jgi:hypothetical protein
MGNDAALAVMSTKPRMIYDFFKQLFAQVPPDLKQNRIYMQFHPYL